MVKINLKKHQDKLRFAIVGGANTVVDFGLLFLLTHLGLPEIVSNYISTGVSFIISFFANKKFTFKDNSKSNSKQVILFCVVTLFGLWVVQPIIIKYLVPAILSLLNLSFSSEFNLLLAKAFATGVTMVWNYCLYARVVFKKQPSANNTSESEE